MDFKPEKKGNLVHKNKVLLKLMKSAMSTSETICKYADEWVPIALLEQAKRKQTNPIFILISGPQGSGKSYNTAVLHEHLKSSYNCISVSIDDFYLTYVDQCRINERYRTNSLLKGRGLPGTHDMELLKLFLEQLKAGDEVINIPQYDKSAFGGKGDRSNTVVKAKTPVDIVIIEGWFLGFQPLTEEELEVSSEKDLVNSLKEVNRFLGTYAELLWNNSQLLTLGITFATNNLDNIRTWRLQQEHELISKTGNGMTDEEVVLFLQRYFHCYKVYYEKFIRSKSLGNFHNIVIGLTLQRTVNYVL